MNGKRTRGPVEGLKSDRRVNEADELSTGVGVGAFLRGLMIASSAALSTAGVSSLELRRAVTVKDSGGKNRSAVRLG